MMFATYILYKQVSSVNDAECLYKSDLKSLQHYTHIATNSTHAYHKVHPTVGVYKQIRNITVLQISNILVIL